MHALRRLMGLMLLAGLAIAPLRGTAGDSCRPWRPSCGCGDDYHPKKLSLLPWCLSYLCDDYCPKSQPPDPPRAPCTGIDDYQRACCPIHIPPACGPSYTCGPPERCHQCIHASGE